MDALTTQCFGGIRFSAAAVQLYFAGESAGDVQLYGRGYGRDGGGQRIGYCGLSAGGSGCERDLVWECRQVSAAVCVCRLRDRRLEGESAVDDQRGCALGVRCAGDGGEGEAGEPGCRLGVCGSRSGAGERSDRDVDGTALSKLVDAGGQKWD